MHTGSANRRRTTPALIAVLAAFATVPALGTACQSQPQHGVPTVEIPVDVPRDADLADQVPEAIKDGGLLEIGTDPAYPPMEYLTADGLLTGVDIQLAQAVAATLGLSASFRPEAFTALESAVLAGRFEMGIAALSAAPGQTWDVDSVLYLASGTRLARPHGSQVSLTQMCGSAISVLEGSAQVAQLAAASQDCVAAGASAITVVASDDLETATHEVLLDAADALVGDSPVVQSTALRFANELELTGETASPVSLAILTTASEPALSALVSAAVDRLIADGVYDAILRAHGLTEGAVIASAVVAAGHPAPAQVVPSRPVAPAQP